MATGRGMSDNAAAAAAQVPPPAPPSRVSESEAWFRANERAREAVSAAKHEELKKINREWFDLKRANDAQVNALKLGANAGNLKLFEKGTYHSEGSKFDVYFDGQHAVPVYKDTPENQKKKRVGLKYTPAEGDFEQTYGEIMDFLQRACGATSIRIEWDKVDEVDPNQLMSLLRVAEDRGLAVEFGPNVEKALAKKLSDSAQTINDRLAEVNGKAQVNKPEYKAEMEKKAVELEKAADKRFLADDKKLNEESKQSLQAKLDGVESAREQRSQAHAAYNQSKKPADSMVRDTAGGLSRITEQYSQLAKQQGEMLQSLQGVQENYAKLTADLNVIGQRSQAIVEKLQHKSDPAQIAELRETLKGLSEMRGDKEALLEQNRDLFNALELSSRELSEQAQDLQRDSAAPDLYPETVTQQKMSDELSREQTKFNESKDKFTALKADVRQSEVAVQEKATEVKATQDSAPSQAPSPSPGP